MGKDNQFGASLPARAEGSVRRSQTATDLGGKGRSGRQLDLEQHILAFPLSRYSQPFAVQLGGRVSVRSGSAQSHADSEDSTGKILSILFCVHILHIYLIIFFLLQTLANFTKFGGKEHYMEFMNVFVGREWENMRQYLLHISTVGASPQQRLLRDHLRFDTIVDQGRELALLHGYLDEVRLALLLDIYAFIVNDDVISELIDKNRNNMTMLCRCGRRRWRKRLRAHRWAICDRRCTIFRLVKIDRPTRSIR